jgi:hypothetical protein
VIFLLLCSMNGVDNVVVEWEASSVWIETAMPALNDAGLGDGSSCRVIVPKRFISRDAKAFMLFTVLSFGPVAETIRTACVEGLSTGEQDERSERQFLTNA